MDDACKNKGHKYFNVETWMLFAPLLSKFLATRLLHLRLPMSQNSSYATDCHVYIFREGSSFRPTSARSEVPC